MASILSDRSLQKRLVTKPADPHGLILEAWAQGFMVGALIIMSCITLVNMRRGVILHKLILVELLFGIWHGFFIFNDPPVYGWYLSVSAIFLNISWSLHNVIAWMKNKPFLSPRVSRLYIISVALVQPYWVIEIYANFTYFNNINGLFVHTRPFEALFRDPWWIFTTCSLFYNIKSRYELTIPEILRLSPRFAVMLVAMLLSICFLVTDICSVTGVFNDSLPLGINPFWKMSFVFKCLTDSVILDDFKTALDRLRAFKISRLGSFAVDNSAASQDWRKGLSDQHHPWAMDPMPSPDSRMANADSIFAPRTGVKHNSARTNDHPKPRGDVSPIGAIFPESSWENLKPSTDHLEDNIGNSSTLPRGPSSRDRDDEENVVGFASKRGLKQPEPSWLGMGPSNDVVRSRRTGGNAKGNSSTGVEELRALGDDGDDEYEDIDPKQRPGRDNT